MVAVRQLGRKVVTHKSKSDLPLSYVWLSLGPFGTGMANCMEDVFCISMTFLPKVLTKYSYMYLENMITDRKKGRKLLYIVKYVEEGWYVWYGMDQY